MVRKLELGGSDDGGGDGGSNSDGVGLIGVSSAQHKNTATA